jgi:hypothetical protein
VGRVERRLEGDGQRPAAERGVELRSGEREAIGEAAASDAGDADGVERLRRVVAVAAEAPLAAAAKQDLPRLGVVSARVHEIEPEMEAGIPTPSTRIGSPVPSDAAILLCEGGH